ncbi:2321_t:CDS:2, partial [Funneliformis caledonium]
YLTHQNGLTEISISRKIYLLDICNSNKFVWVDKFEHKPTTSNTCLPKNTMPPTSPVFYFVIGALSGIVVSVWKLNVRSGSLSCFSDPSSTGLRSSYRFSSIRLENWGTSSKNNRQIYQSYITSDSENKDNNDAKSSYVKGKNKQTDNTTQTKTGYKKK